MSEGVVVAQLFTKRPETVEAVQYRPHETCGELCALLGFPRGAEACCDVALDGDLAAFKVETWQGPYEAQPGDWVVRDSAGQVHVYTDKSFQAAYAPLLEGRP